MEIFRFESRDNSSIVDADPDHIVSQLKKCGAVLVSSPNTDMKAFHEFGITIGKNFYSQQTGIFRDSVSNDKIVTEVVRGGFRNVPWHQERGFEPDRPDIGMIYCKRPADSGGETIFFDGIEVLKMLDPQIRDIFMKKRVTYTHVMDEDFWSRRYGKKDRIVSMFDKSDEKIEYEFSNDNILTYKYTTSAIRKSKYQAEPAFVNGLITIWTNDHATPENRVGSKENHVNFEDGEELSRDLVEQVVKTCDENSLQIVLKSNEVLIFDNTRLQHGRLKFKGDRLAYNIFCDLK